MFWQNIVGVLLLLLASPSPIMAANSQYDEGHGKYIISLWGAGVGYQTSEFARMSLEGGAVTWLLTTGIYGQGKIRIASGDAWSIKLGGQAGSINVIGAATLGCAGGVMEYSFDRNSLQFFIGKYTSESSSDSSTQHDKPDIGKPTGSVAWTRFM